MRSKDREMIKLFVAGMVIYSCCSEPAVDVCEVIFQRATHLESLIRMGNETLKGDIEWWFWAYPGGSEGRETVCRIAGEVLTNIFDNPEVMMCPETAIDHFRPKTHDLFYDIERVCFPKKDKQHDFYLECGFEHLPALENCVRKKLPATLRSLIDRRNIDKYELCKEAPELKICGSKHLRRVDRCKRYKSLIYEWHDKKVAALQCEKYLLPVAQICQNIFDYYTTAKDNLREINKKLGGFPLGFVWDWKFTRREQERICSTARELISSIFDSPYVMQCTQRVHNFMTENKVFYYVVIKKCNIRDRWDRNCGDIWVFEKCLGKNMLTTLRYLTERQNSDKCQVCKESGNMKKCVRKAYLCRKLKEQLYSWHSEFVARLQCRKNCPGIVGNWESPYPPRLPAETRDRAPKVAAVIAGVAGVLVLVVLLGISYAIFRGKRSLSMPARDIRFTASNKVEIHEQPADANSSTDTTTPPSKRNEKPQRSERSKLRYESRK